MTEPGAPPSPSWRGPPWAEGRRWSGRPPWWPEGEPWPPRGAAGWQGVRRRFVRRVALFLGVLFAFALLAGGALFWAGVRYGNATHRTGHWMFFPIGLGVFVLLLVVLIRGARRTAGPVEDVMDAAGRLAHGDYGVRVTPRGPREVRDLGRSFNAMAERLEANERVRRQLFADVAHELRTPLTVVQANVEGVLDGLYPADRAHLEPVLEEAKVISRLLDDLSTLAMAEAGALRLHVEAISPQELVGDVVAAHDAEAGARGIALAVTTGGGLPLMQIDPVRFREVLSNLISNAIRYTPSGGRITVRTEPRAGGTVAFSVADTGPGIPLDRLSRVFDRFAKSPDSRGAGLGLAIAKSLVEAHGGSIRATSDGSGTVFTFVLPVGHADGASGGPERVRFGVDGGPG